MNILLIAQCSKNALTQSRRILDQFAERRGDCTWQTPITQQGLDTLKRLLKKTARKNTAVACHWIRGKNHSELLWIVGDASRFNSYGTIPTNTTQRDILRKNDENDWHHLEEIRLFSGLAALFHDIGKANIAFQNKLKNNKQPIADALRHEWVSLRLFEAFVLNGKEKVEADNEWLERLVQLSNKPDELWLTYLKKDGMVKNLPSPFKQLPPLAQLIGWLIVSHHRLPKNGNNEGIKPEQLTRFPREIASNWCGARKDAKPKDIQNCWTFPLGIFSSKAWRLQVSKIAKRIQNRAGVFDINWLDNPYVVHLSRLTLMLADHHYSSLTELTRRKKGDKNYSLYANTNRKTNEPNQPLDEHLIGVEAHSKKIIHALPQLEQHLPRIARHKGFKQRSSNKHFQWQDKAYDLACSLHFRSTQQGFFGINMASTGCGKTLGNGRIMYALADPLKGARFTIALGLRVLTLQTGEVYRQCLGLTPDDLAVLTGGTAIKTLFHHNNKLQEDQYGAESSAEGLLPEQTYVHFEDSLIDGPLKEWLSKKKGEVALLNAPIVTCTIDHLMPATESTRGGHQILPMLRLLTSDLILDEPDDFSLEDLPALSRLVYWTGLLGSRVLLSSATLPPALVEGLFKAYCAGRKIYQKNRGVRGLPLSVCCAWFDEFSVCAGEQTEKTFLAEHNLFVDKRLEKLATQEIKRCAIIQPITHQDKIEDKPALFAQSIHPFIFNLHQDHHSVDPLTEKRVSFGLIRMANIDPLVDVTKKLLELGANDEHYIHICCYHSRHPLLIRAEIELRLDRLLNRKKSNAEFFADSELRDLLNSSTIKNHIFIVLATAVAEVGRDHDYDWAIVEPSSMRSIIQLAGRIKRHRSGECQIPNLYLLNENIKALKGDKFAYHRPGFEGGSFPLSTHLLENLLTPEQYKILNAGPRIKTRNPLHAQDNLVDLEHAHLQDLMMDGTKKVPVDLFWKTYAHLTAELQRQSPFRFDYQIKSTFGFFPAEEGDQLIFKMDQGTPIWQPQEQLIHHHELSYGQNIDFWSEFDYLKLLNQLANSLQIELDYCAKRFGIVDLPVSEGSRKWDYHIGLGFSRYHEG